MITEKFTTQECLILYRETCKNELCQEARLIPIWPKLERSISDRTFDQFAGSDEGRGIIAALAEEGELPVPFGAIRQSAVAFVDGRSGVRFVALDAFHAFIRWARPDVNAALLKLVVDALSDGTPGKPSEHWEADLDRDCPSGYAVLQAGGVFD